MQKAGFASALSGTHALQTDTLNPYPVGNESAAILYLDTFQWLGRDHFSITFWHYYDTDTLTDSCLVQISSDSGKTWQTVVGGWSYPVISYSGSLNNYQGWGGTDTLFWSGNSGGWRKESLCVAFVGIKGLQIPRQYGIRFLFHSNSVETISPAG